MSEANDMTTRRCPACGATDYEIREHGHRRELFDGGFAPLGVYPVRSAACPEECTCLPPHVSMDAHLHGVGWLRPGVVVDYHSVIGGPVTQAGLTVRYRHRLTTGQVVVFLDGKRGCVAPDALSPHANGLADNRGES